MVDKIRHLKKYSVKHKRLVDAFCAVFYPYTFNQLAYIQNREYRAITSDVYTGYYGNLYGAWGVKEITSPDYFESFIELSFENRKYMAPIGYDRFLKDIYGDYMKLPPIDKRISHHDFDMWWNDVSE